MTLHTEIIGDMTVIECEGRIVGSEAAFSLHNAVTSQPSSRTVVLDLSEVSTIEGSGLGMLCFLQSWAKEFGIQLKMFNPTYSVKNRLESTNAVAKFDIATLQEMMALLEESTRLNCLKSPSYRESASPIVAVADTDRAGLFAVETRFQQAPPQGQ